MTKKMDRVKVCTDFTKIYDYLYNAATDEEMEAETNRNKRVKVCTDFTKIYDYLYSAATDEEVEAERTKGMIYNQYNEVWYWL